MTRNTIPQNVRNSLGLIKTEKGSWHGIPLVLWDFTQECDRENCLINEYCPYETAKVRVSKTTKDTKYMNKCVLHAKYLRSVFTAALSKMDEKTMSLENSIKLGYHLIPLYNQLFKFKLTEYGLQHQPVMGMSSRGGMQVNPLFREIRDTIKALTAVWKDLGSKKEKSLPKPDMGDSDFIEALFGDEEVSEELDADNEDGIGMDFDNIPEPDMPKKRSTNSKRKWAGNKAQPGTRNKKPKRKRTKKPPGRPKGKKDSKPRKLDGYRKGEKWQ